MRAIRRASIIRHHRWYNTNVQMEVRVRAEFFNNGCGGGTGPDKHRDGYKTPTGPDNELTVRATITGPEEGYDIWIGSYAGPQTLTESRFRVELVAQDAQPASRRAIRYRGARCASSMAGVEIWNDEANLTSSALCLLRTTRGDFVGPIGGVSDTNPLIHHCGALARDGLSDRRVVARAAHRRRRAYRSDRSRERRSAQDEDDCRAAATPFVIERDVYADQIRAFAIAVRDGLETRTGRYTRHTGSESRADVRRILGRIRDAAFEPRAHRDGTDAGSRSKTRFASADEPVVEAAPGTVPDRRLRSGAQRARSSRARSRALWNGATINADRSIDRSVRDAEVLDEAAQCRTDRRLRDLLFDATRDLASELVPGIRARGSATRALSSRRSLSRSSRYAGHRRDAARALARLVS